MENTFFIRRWGGGAGPRNSPKSKLRKKGGGYSKGKERDMSSGEGKKGKEEKGGRGKENF